MDTKRAKGFTLIEMTVSLVLLSFITIIGYQGLMFGLSQWQNGNNKMSFQYECYQALGWMRDKLGTAELVKDINKDERGYFFIGNNDSVEFVARYHRSSYGGLYVNKIMHSKDDKNIYVSYYLHHPDVISNLESGVQKKIELLSDVKSVKFFYYGEKKGKNAQWYSSWGDAVSFPELVRVEIENISGEYYESTIHIETSNNA